jgi:hypothetical protein
MIAITERSLCVNSLHSREGQQQRGPSKRAILADSVTLPQRFRPSFLVQRQVTITPIRRQWQPEIRFRAYEPILRVVPFESVRWPLSLCSTVSHR